MQRISLDFFSEEKVDLDVCPKATKNVLYPQKTIGDLHGNALKFLYFLIREDVLILSEDNYKEFVEIYNASRLTTQNWGISSVPLITKENIEKFKSILSQASINPAATKEEVIIRLIGDELADRGGNDYYTLRIFEKLKQGGVCVEVLLSNHSAEFIEAMERGEIADAKTDIPQGYVNSLQSLQMLIKKKLVTKDEIMQLYKKSYQPYLKAIGYTLMGREITIYTHAPVGLEVVEQVAKKLGIKYDDSSAKALAETIDKINEKFKECVVSGHVKDLYSRTNKGKDILPPDDPFNLLMWHRPYTGITPHKYRPKREPVHNGYYVTYVHGHDSHDKTGTMSNVFNLDSELGKLESKGEYSLVKAIGRSHIQLEDKEEKEEKFPIELKEQKFPPFKKLMPRTDSQKIQEIQQIEALVAESEQIMREYKESGVTEHSELIKIKLQAMRIQAQLKKHALIKEASVLYSAVLQPIDDRIEEAMHNKGIKY